MATTSTIFQKVIYHQVSWLPPKPWRSLEKRAEQEAKLNRFMEVEGLKRVSRYRVGTLSSLLESLYAQPLSQRHVEADGLVFDPAQITKRTASGVVVPHGDHYHFIPYSQMSALEEQIARSIPIGQTPSVLRLSQGQSPTKRQSSQAK